MKEKLNVLIDLQSLESEVAGLNQSLEKIPIAIKDLDTLFLDLKQKLTHQTEKIEALQKGYRSQELEVDTISSRITKSREKMDAVKTNKEYQSILKEIKEMEDKRSGIEDQMLADLDAIENEQVQLKQLKTEMEQLEKSVATRKATIQKEGEALNEQLQSAKKQRDAQYDAVDAEMLEVYKRVQMRVTGAALAAVTNAVCQGCHLTIPPQMYNELQRQDSLKFCPHCHRIIYWLAAEG